MKYLAATPRWLIALVVSVFPVVATYVLTKFYLHANLLNFTPFFWNDQTWYWHQTLSFSQVGFASGYYVVNEAAAPLAFFKFSSASPFFPVVYGAVGHFIGWGWLTGIAFNMVLLTGAVLVFIHLAYLDKIQILFTGFILLFIGPVLMFLPTNSLETFHQAGALVLAGLFYRLWTRTISRRLWWIGLGFFIFISLLRLSWVILLPAYFILRYDRITLRRLIVSLVASGLLAAIVFTLVSIVTSPGHNAIVGRVNNVQSSILVTLAVLAETTMKNFSSSFLGGGNLQEAFADRVQGIQIAIVIISALVMTFPTRELRSRLITKPFEMPFHIYNLGVIILLSLFLYIFRGYYRIFGIHLLLSLLLLIAFRRLALVGIIIALGVITFGIVIDSYIVSTNGDLSQNVSAIETTRQQWSEFMPYQQNADPWCNTILLPVELLDGRILNVPAGIGVSFFISAYPLPTVDKPIRSHYLLLDAKSFQYLKKGNLNVQELSNTPDGTLYINEDAPCSLHPTK